MRVKVAPDIALMDGYIYKLLEQHGKNYDPAVLPKDIERGPLSNCFDNSFLQAIRHPKYRYVEGIGITRHQGTVTIATHAWLTDGTHAFDPTWSAYNVYGQEVPMPTTYRGIELDIEAVTEYILATGNQGVMVNRTLKPRLYKQVLKESGLL